MQRLKRKFSVRIFLALCAVYLSACAAFGQGPAAQADESAAKSAGDALKSVLAAACSQSQNEFLSFLTKRNREAFSRMTPPARVALMKRFVLLNEPGKPAVSANPSGRPLVKCQTPAVTTEMQIGGTELRENIAFLPLEIRDATDSTGANVHQVTMGLVREDGEWKLLSLGLLLLDLPALEVEWDAAEIDSTEQTAIDSLKKVAAAVEAYREKYLHLPESLGNLGPPLHGAANAEAAGMLDSDLATGAKNGYSIRYVILGASTLGAPAKFELAATPQQYGRTGTRSFFRDLHGVMHAADRHGAVGSEADPKVE